MFCHSCANVPHTSLPTSQSAWGKIPQRRAYTPKGSMCRLHGFRLLTYTELNTEQLYVFVCSVAYAPAVLATMWPVSRSPVTSVCVQYGTEVNSSTAVLNSSSTH